MKKKSRGNGTGTVYKVGNKWRATVTVGYKEDKKRITLTRSFDKKTDAVNALPTLRQLYEPKGAISASITFEDCFEQMMKQHRKRIGENTAENYYFVFKHFSPIGFLKIESVKTSHLQSCVDSVNGKSMKTKMKAVASLAFKYAMQNDIVSKNYAEYIVIERTEENEREPFNASEIQKIVENASTSWECLYIATLIFTGMRPSEMFALRKSDWHGSYFVGGSKTEAGKNRLIPIPSIIQPEIERIAENADDYIFCTPDGGKMDLSHFRSRYYYQTLELLGIRKLPPYSCRHTFATLLKNVNAPITDKQRLMGHSSFSMTAHYTHTDIDSLQKVSEDATKWIKGSMQ